MTSLEEKPSRRKSRPEAFNRTIEKPPVWTFEQALLIKHNIRKNADETQDIPTLFSMILGDD